MAYNKNWQNRGTSHQVSDGASIMDIERHPVDDNSLIFVFQSKLFNIQAEYDTEKFLRAVMFLDAHMKPYAWRWKDKQSMELEIMEELPMETPDELPNALLGYESRKKKLMDKYMIMMDEKFKVVDIEGKRMKVEMTPDQIQYEWAIEWYRLIRRLLQEANILPRGFVDETID